MSPPAGVPISYPGRQPYTSAPMPYIPTPSSGGRNRYAEIMSQFGQSQPFSFFGMPSGGFNPYASDYTGGFTPYQRTFTPQPIVNPVEPTVPMVGGGGGGGRSDADREGPSAFSQMTPAERAAYYAERPIEGSLALGAQNYFTYNPLVFLSKLTNPDAFYDSRLEKLGLDPESFAYGPPDPNFSSQAAAAARNEALQGAIAAANADTGLVANPMSVDPSQRVVSTPVVTAPPVVAPAITEGLLSTPIVETPVVAPVPVVTAPPVVAPAPAPAPAPVLMMKVTETYQGDDPNPPGNWTRTRIGRDEYRLTREVSVPAETRVNQEDGSTYTVPVGYTGSGGGYYGDATPGGSFGFVQAPGERGGGRGYSPSPGTGSYGDARSDLRGGDGFAKGGYVSMQRLQGPNPAGPDDGYAALKDGEYVINDKAVKKYGIELMEAINSGKISKGKLRGLLEM